MRRPSAPSAIPPPALREQFRRDVLNGLGRTAKHLPSKYFYDRPGCELFDAICELDEYYLTRTELAILRQHVDEIVCRIPTRGTLVEFGSGSSVKTRLLLDRLEHLAGYIPVDIAREHLVATANRLAMIYPVPVFPVCADFTRPFSLPWRTDPVVVYFPGSTIGNLTAEAAIRLLRRIAALVTPGGGCLLGADLIKDREILESAYNDRDGVTAAFNLNLLVRINRELDGTFQLDQFYHEAIYNDQQHRIEMYLVSRVDQEVAIGDRRFCFGRGERICTEYSHKYSLEGLQDLASRAGLTLEHAWTDDREHFAVLYLAARP